MAPLLIVRLLVLGAAHALDETSSTAWSGADGRRLETCVDNTEWRVVNSRGMEKNCDWVSKKTPKRCKKEGSDGTGTVTSAWTSCPVTCGTCCSGTCCDSTSWHYETENKGCGWAGQGNKWRCSKSDGMGVLAHEACPMSCDACPPAEPKCDGACCDSYSWYHHLPRKGCDWVAEKRWRCSTKADGAGVLAEDACQVSCGTCPEPPGPTAKPTFRVLSPTAPTAEKTKCLTAKGAWEGLTEDFCGTCCPACEAFSTFSFSLADPNACACVDFSGENKLIFLTSSTDCARITGDDNWVWGGDGNDAMYSNGDDNTLYGDRDDDHLAAGGSENSLFGGLGDGDVCTDLSGSNSFSSTSCDGNCYGPGGVDVPLDCATGETFSPTAKPTA